MWPIIYVNFITLAIFAVHSSYATCIDGDNNKFIVESTKDKLPVMMSNLIVQTYDDKWKPSCLHDRPNVVLPGYALLLKGQLKMPKKLSLKNHTVVKLTVRNREGTVYCKRGESTVWFLRHCWCVLDLCEFVGEKFCEVVEKPGVHTVQEIIDKADFNPKLKLPEPPCIAMLCLTDFFGGDWEVEFFIEYKNQLMLHFKVPSREKYLQVAASDDEDSEDDNDDDEKNKKKKLKAKKGE